MIKVGAHKPKLGRRGSASSKDQPLIPEFTVPGMNPRGEDTGRNEAIVACLEALIVRFSVTLVCFRRHGNSILTGRGGGGGAIPPELFTYNPKNPVGERSGLREARAEVLLALAVTLVRKAHNAILDSGDAGQFVPHMPASLLKTG